LRYCANATVKQVSIAVRSVDACSEMCPDKQ
jgi:hypothetical protein